MRVGRRRNTARRARTGKLREEGPGAVAISVGSGNNPDQRDLQIPDIPSRDPYIIAPTILPVCIIDGERWTRGTRQEIRRKEYLRPILLGISRCLRIRSRDENATVLHKQGFRVVHSRDGCVGHDAHATVNWPAWVVEDCVEVWVFGEPETCDSDFGAVED